MKNFPFPVPFHLPSGSRALLIADMFGVIRGIKTGKRTLRVYLQGAPFEHLDLHHFWLRSQSDLDRHPTTNERVVDSSEIDLESVVPESVNFTERELKISWMGENHVSTFTTEFLVENAYAPDLEEVPSPPSRLSRIMMDATTFGSLRELIPNVLSQVEKDGVAIVTGCPADSEGHMTEELIEAVEQCGLVLQETHFGRVEDLRTDNSTNRNTDQLGYTDSGVQLHTDQPFIAKPPKFQMLQCVRPADKGGESFLVDGLAAARYLKSIDEDAFNLLSSIPVRFHRKQKAFESKQVKPILDFDSANAPFQIRYSYFSMAPHIVPFGKMESYYRAYSKFAKIVRDNL